MACWLCSTAWDQLAEEFKANANVAIIDVDCTKDESKSLCSKFGVKGYPTVKYFTDSTDAMGADYKGGRTFEELKKFADEVCANNRCRIPPSAKHVVSKFSVGVERVQCVARNTVS